MQDCIISTADTLEILQFCSKPSISLYIITVIQPSLFTLVKTSFKMHYRYYCPNSGTINAYVVDKTVKIYDNICSYLCRHLLFYRSCKSPTRAHHDGMVGINESPPNAAYMCQWIGSALVQIIVLANHPCTCVLHRQLSQLHTLKLPQFFHFHGDFHQNWHFCTP